MHLINEIATNLNAHTPVDDPDGGFFFSLFLSFSLFFPSKNPSKQFPSLPFPFPFPLLDYFSHEYATMRGRNWRGRDCGGHNDQIYPGRKAHDGDRYVDSNCNGIYGVDPATNKTYEELYCSQPQKGLMILGLLFLLWLLLLLYYWLL